MGILDIVNSVAGGSQMQGQSPQGQARGAFSPMTLALVGLLAYKAFKGSGGARPANAPTPSDSSAGAGGGGLGGLLGSLFGGAGSGSLGDELGKLIPGGVGQMAGGASAGSVISGGLGNLMRDMQNVGQGGAANSWVGTGPNQEISPNGLAAALGDDALDALARQTGMSRDELLSNLSKYLPGFVDKLTPNGRLPTEQEASRLAA